MPSCSKKTSTEPAPAAVRRSPFAEHRAPARCSRFGARILPAASAARTSPAPLRRGGLGSGSGFGCGCGCGCGSVMRPAGAASTRARMHRATPQGGCSASTSETSRRAKVARSTRDGARTWRDARVRAKKVRALSRSRACAPPKTRHLHALRAERTRTRADARPAASARRAARAALSARNERRRINQGIFFATPTQASACSASATGRVRDLHRMASRDHDGARRKNFRAGC